MRNTYRVYNSSRTYNTPWDGEETHKIPEQVLAEMRRLEDDNAAYVPTDEYLTPDVWKVHFIWPNNMTTNQCTCLMRYFVEELGPWVGCCPTRGAR